MSDKIKYTIPKAFYKVFEDIGNEVYEVSAELMDRELYEDLIKDMDKRFYWEDYKSNKEFDKDYIYHSDVRLLAKLISQLILFHRLIRTNSSDEKNNPQNEVPLFFRQFDEDGKQNDLFDISSGKIFKKWSKKPKGRKKLEEFLG